MRYKIAWVLIAYITLVFVLNKPTYAQEGYFDTTYNIEYEVDNSSVVSVKENIGVINQDASSVPSSFIETITNISVYDIKILDAKDKEIQPEVNIKEGGKETEIRIPIKDPAMGKGRKTQVTLLYKTKDLAGKSGRILNLHIPKAPVSNFIQEYNVRIKIPRGFGPQISVTPVPFEEKKEEEGYVLLYNKQTLENYGISASFGDYQIFDFEIEYDLKNDSLLTKNMSVTFPPPIENYQEISLLSVTPKPIELRKDADGNILASYKVDGRKTLNVKAIGKAKVYTKETEAVDYNADYTIPGGMGEFVKAQSYWETRNKDILELTKSLISKDKSVTQNALSIYTYITKNISYNFEKAKDIPAQAGGSAQDRKGALQTLKDKKGLCLDFTDLFIALARSAGIPAREVDGYAYAKDFGPASIVLHSWAQYYSPQMGWVSIDPTWGATSGLDFFSKLDNNHLAFAIKGVDSQNPQPPVKFSVSFSGDDYYNNNSLYDLENLPQNNNSSAILLVILLIVLTLGMCTTLILSKVRSKRRYR